ncbi:MAG: DUF4065 domain-containing protein [Leptospiraceae bacterium]|nr:DUF4065 domain-containing protein [Leptospiraceae bacterium]
MSSEKLSSVISFILKKSLSGRGRIELSKLLYYCEGVYFQRHSNVITNQKYIHLEDSPYPYLLNETILEMKNEGYLDVQPKLTKNGVGGFLIVLVKEYDDLLDKEEKRIITKVLEAYKNGVTDESKHYPNLYENYVITPLYSEIAFRTDTINTKIHFFKKKSLLSISGKIFRVLFND